MKPNILTHRYAKAFLDLAMQKDVVDKCHDDLRLVKNTFENNEELRTLIHQPFLSKERKKNILTRIFKDRTESITIDLLCLLIENNRDEILSSIYDVFHELYLDYKKIAVVAVTSAVDLDDDTINRIVNILKHKIVGKDTIEVERNIDKSIIGGFIVRYGDYEYDASVRNTLKRLHSEFEKNLFVKEY